MTSTYGLALHTTTAALGLALRNVDGKTHGDPNGDARTRVWELGRSLSNKLHLLLPEFLTPQTWQDLAFLAVAKGPGSFTGTRIGMVTARTLAQQLDIPLFAVSTLAAIARSAQLQDPNFPGDRDIAVQMMASRGQIFTAIYKPAPDKTGLTTLVPDTARAIDDWQALLDRWHEPYTLVRVREDRLAASVDRLLELASLDYARGERPHWSQALPFYGQHPVRSSS